MLDTVVGAKKKKKETDVSGSKELGADQWGDYDEKCTAIGGCLLPNGESFYYIYLLLVLREGCIGLQLSIIDDAYFFSVKHVIFVLQALVALLMILIFDFIC